MNISKSITKFLSLLLVIFIISCSKKDDPVTDLGTTAAGTYHLTSISLNGTVTSLPSTPIYTVNIERVDNSTANVTLNLSSATTLGKVGLSGSTNSINLNYSDIVVQITGTILNGSQISITIKDSQSVFILAGTK